MTYRGSIAEYVRLFQGIEIQIPAPDMTIGDRKHRFLTSLPTELAMQLMQQPQTDMAAIYTAARQWESLRKVARADTHLPPTNRAMRRARSNTTSVSQHPTTLPHLPHTPVASTSTLPGEPMDLDLMNQSRDPRPVPPGTRCYNCNSFGHFSRDCKKPAAYRRPIAGNSRVLPRDRLQRPAQLHHLEEDRPQPSGENPVELEEPYQHSGVQPMEVIEEAPEEEEEDDTEIYTGNEPAEDMYVVEEPEEGWSSASTLRSDSHDLSTWDVDEESDPPLEMFSVASANLPVYAVKIGPLHAELPNDAASFILVRAIMDTGAESNYITAHKARLANAQVFPIERREIIGAGRTTTSAFARFTLKIGGLLTQCLAYVLNDSSNFRYDLLLGRSWLKKHDAFPHWKDDSYELLEPATQVRMRVKPLPTKTSGSPTNALASLAWRLRIRPCPARINSLYCAEEDTRDGESSRTTAGSVVSPDHESPQPANQTFGERLKAIVKKAVPSVFRDKVGFPPPRRWMHDIDVGDAKPLKRFGRPLTPLEHEAIKRFVDEGIKEGVIEPSESPWSSPLLPVPKKDGTTRICVDYRALNTLTKQNAYPLPRIDECYQNLAGAKYFTCLDLRSGYWQVRLTEEAKEKTAFTCRYGHYQFRVMPFGLTNAPATFQSMMNDILREYIDKCAMVYLDDIIIFSKNEKDHIENVLAVVRELQNEGLVLNEGKCEWGRSSILYLGHIASGDGLRPNPDKVSAILKWPSRSTITEVRGFLNIAGYYRRFIRGFAKEASPLYKLLEGSPRKGSPIQWTEECESAMRRLKKALTSADILIHPTPWHLFVIDTDASGNCIGAVLQQTKDAFEGFARGKAIKEKGEKSSSLFKEKDLCPIAFDSRRMTPTEQRYSAQEREMLAVVYALQKWRGYIEGSPILVRTDHESLKHFLTQKNLGRRLARFADDIAHFNVEIVYRPGKHQLVADALSRRKGHSNVPDLETVQPMFAGPMGPLENSKDHDEVYRTFRNYKNRLEAGEDPNTVGNGSYSLKNDTLQKNAVNRWGEEVTVEVPLTPEAAEEAVKKVHLDLGHLGASTMLTALRIRYNIPFITEIVDKVVRTCDSCQFTKREPTTLQPLHPIPRVEPGDVWALDFVGPLPKTQKGNQYILTAMDLGTDWTIAQAAPHRSREVVVAMLRYVLTTHGKPLRILTDNGEEFTSYLVQNVLRRFGIEHQHTTPYHPQTNG